MSRTKLISKVLSILLAFSIATVGLASPALAYSTSDPAPPGAFTSPAWGETILVGNHHRPNLGFMAPADPGYSAYWSRFEIQYMTNIDYQWKPSTNVWVYDAPGFYEIGDMHTFYQPYGTLVRFRVRTVTKSQAVSTWEYSGYFKRNTPVMTAPVLNITPDPDEVDRCYDDVVQLSWQPCPADVDGQEVRYLVELGRWDGERSVYQEVADTTDTLLTYDISKSSYHKKDIPAIEPDQEFAFRIKATDGVDDTLYSEITGLRRSSAPAAGSPDQTALIGDGSAVHIHGAVEPAMVSAEVALNACFVIQPNVVEESERFIAPVIRIRNTSPMPVELSILSCTAAGNAPKVVGPDTYSLDQWKKLGAADSKRFIALGLESVRNDGFWFQDESSQEPLSLGNFNAGESSDYVIQARFGLAWKEQENFQYDMIFEIRLVP